jgi:hypothetical protein
MVEPTVSPWGRERLTVHGLPVYIEAMLVVVTLAFT